MGRQAIVAGTGYPNNDGSNRNTIIAKHVKKNIAVTLKRDKDNAYDPNAIAVFIDIPRLFGLLGKSSKQIGYIKAGAAAGLSKKLDSGETINAFVSSFDLYNIHWPRVSLTLEY